MKKLFSIVVFSFLLLSHRYVESVPVRVPIERYAGGEDKRGHPGHYPFISYLTFRNICDKIIDDHTEWFDPDEVQIGDTIYVNIWYLDWFVKFVHDHIKHPYILVSGDVGAWLPHPELKKILYDPKLAAWFCRNMVFSYHPKLFQIPMGQDFGLFHVHDYTSVPCLLETMKRKELPREHLLHMCHYPRTHGNRDQIIQLFENEPYCLSRNHSGQPFDYVPRPEYFNEMVNCQFVLSPLGLETDCVRTWEALVLDCIPIVEHTFLDASYDKLPVVMVHDWKEINPEFLERKYQELKEKKRDEAFFDYWYDLIKGVQKKVRGNDLSFSQLEATKFCDEDLDELFLILSEGGVLNRPFFYKGFLSTLRPLQVAGLLNGAILLHDPWLDYDAFFNLGKYIEDYSLYENIYRIYPLLDEKKFMDVLILNERCSVFLDLTYYRTSLSLNFQTSVIGYGNFRHSLKQDLVLLYEKLPQHSFLCGNMVNNDYVKEVLEMFSEEKGVTVNTRGSFWHLIKK